jgi:hypothetical protein
MITTLGASHAPDGRESAKLAHQELRPGLARLVFRPLSPSVQEGSTTTFIGFGAEGKHFPEYFVLEAAELYFLTRSFIRGSK